MEELCVLIIIILFYQKYKRRHDGDYQVIHSHYEKNGDRIIYYVDLQNRDTSKILLNQRISGKHQILASTFNTMIRIKSGVLYFVQNDIGSSRTKLTLLERKDRKLP